MATFRRLALALPGAIEGEHQGHPDFRVGGRIFASLWTDGESGMVLVMPSTQRELMESWPETFTPANGEWGRRGATRVILATVAAPVLRKALRAAWELRAPGGPTRPQKG